MPAKKTTNQNDEQIDSLDTMRHSMAHVLAAAVKQIFPDAKFAIGPTIDYGFYYDFDLPRSLAPADLPAIEKIMRQIIKKKPSFKRQEMDIKDALKWAKDSGQPYKEELIEDLKKEGEEIVSFYETGAFTDLCRGPHLENTGEIGAFKLTKIAGAYWRGDEKNKMLQRIYGVAFRTEEELASHLQMLEEAEKRDHRKLGKELGLFVFSDLVGKGLPLWTPKGAVIRREIERFIVDEEIKRGYRHVYTPDIANLNLYRTSGHYPYYKDSMYAPIKIDEEEYMLRPMSCPHHFELYKSEPHSYRDLPVRIAELAKLYRYEQSGELTGLIRVRGFCLADAHVIAAPEQAGDEINRALDLIEYAAGIFGFEANKDYWYRLSLGDRSNDKKYYKDDMAWDNAENVLREVVGKRKVRSVEALDEAAFYGPKIDIQMRNVAGKEDTAFTVQYDFVMPKRFKLSYIDQDGQEKEPIVIHRSSVGAIERIIAYLIEKYAGAFPLWLAPVQVALLPVGAGHKEYCDNLAKEFASQGLRVEVEGANETIGNKIRKAEKQKVPYMLVVGDKEIASGELAVRMRGVKEMANMKQTEFLGKLKKEIKDKK